MSRDEIRLERQCFTMSRAIHGEKGFTLIELVLVIAILALLATIAVPKLMSFLATAEVAAANTEVANVESAAMAYYADHNRHPPSNTSTDLVPDYLNREITVDYSFNAYGRVEYPDGAPWGDHTNIIWNETAHQWQSIWE